MLEPETGFANPEYRIEGPAKATGAATYAADFDHEGALEVAFVRSPLPHARILSIDTTEAMSMPGVQAVLTGEDLQPLRLGRRVQDWPILAWDRVLMVGDRVAAIAANTREQAEQAAQAVEVDYEELPPVFGVDAALAVGAPILHPDSDQYRYLAGVRPELSHPNIQGERSHGHGDVDAGFDGASHIFDHTFTLPKAVAGYLEPRASMAWIDGDQIHIVSTNKSPFRLRDQMAAALDVAEDSIVVTTGSIGGDFGGKGLSVDDHVLACLARSTGRKVRTVTRYADDISTTSSRHAGRVRLRTATDSEGHILAHEAWATFDGGAYAAGKPNPEVVPAKGHMALASYKIPAARIYANAVYTNTVPGGNARSPGQPQTAFAAESHLDLIALELGIDPVEVRLRNAIDDEALDVSGSTWKSSTMTDTLLRLRREVEGRPLPDGQARGVASGSRAVAAGKGSVQIKVIPEAKVLVITGVTDQGGGAFTMLQRVVATELGIPIDDVIVQQGNTGDALWDKGVGGSRITPVVGGAAQAGAAALRTHLDEVAPGQTIHEQLELNAGYELVGEFSHPTGVHSTAACFVDLSVDRETGAIALSQILVVADTGTVINPLGAEGQLVGGAANGLGFALMEELVLDEGMVVGANLSEYKLPSAMDMPPIEIVMVEDDKGAGPFGAKSAGELSNFLIAPAIANAVHRAAGVRITSLPITAEKVYRAIQALTPR